MPVTHLKKVGKRIPAWKITSKQELWLESILYSFFPQGFTSYGFLAIQAEVNKEEQRWLLLQAVLVQQVAI